MKKNPFFIRVFSSVLFATIIFLGTLSAPDASAAGLVPCGTGTGPACTTCHLVVGVKGIIDWGMNVMTFFAIAIIVAMGIVYIVSAGNDSMMKKAKDGIKATLIGFAIMLGSWVIVNFFMMTLAQNKVVSQGGKWSEFTCDTASSTKQVDGVDTTPTAPIVAQNLPSGCSNYKSDFASAANGAADKCLLEAIAAAESQCTPSATSPKGACGMMQMLESTARQSCEYLNSHPKESVQLSATYLSSLKSQISAYSGQFNIGEDDLIASYNTGPGNGTNGDQTKQAFYPSKDCPGMPAWQCPVNAGGFSETQKYVKQVQSYKASCQ